MKRWILLVLLALLLWIVITGRERFQDTNGIKGIYGLDGPDPSNPFLDSSAEHLIGLMPSSLLAALKNVKPKTPCPTTADPLKQCKADHTTGTGAMTLIRGDINDIMVAFYLTVYKRSNAVAGITIADVDRFLGTYPMTPFLTANKTDVKALLVAYFVTQPHGVANMGTNDPRLVNDVAPDPATTSPELVARWNAEHGWSDHDAAVRSAGYAEATGYADLLLDNPMAGALSGPADTRGDNGDSSASRPSDGPVFGDNGPFSGEAGTGQGSGMNAASTLTGSSYAHPPPTAGRLDPYDFWPGSGSGSGSGGNRPPAGASIAVEGPNWGGRGTSASTASSSSSKPAPALYGPDPGAPPSRNSTSTALLPSHESAGSDPSNQYVGTSRVPGDQDLFVSPYLQFSTYSIANGSQKTDPVPFLSDFSVFQT